MSVQKFRTVKESIELINNSKLSGAVSVFSQDISLSINTFKYLLFKKKKHLISAFFVSFGGCQSS